MDIKTRFSVGQKVYQKSTFTRCAGIEFIRTFTECIIDKINIEVKMYNGELKTEIDYHYVTKLYPPYDQGWVSEYSSDEYWFETEEKVMASHEENIRRDHEWLIKSQKQ